MKKIRTLLILLMVTILASNALLINAAAIVEGPELLDIDINLEIGRYTGEVFTPLMEGEALHTNDIITVRIAPTSNFLCGTTRYVVMFTKDYLQVVGTGKAAFTPNYENEFFMMNSNDYQGATVIPETGWPAALKSVALGGNGTFTTNSAVAVSNTATGVYPGHLPGEWLFRFNLKVTQNITVGSGVKVWMSDQWIKRPSYTAGAMYFTKCLDSEKLSSFGRSDIYNFNADLAGANISLEPSANVNITFDANGGTGGTGPTSMPIGAALTPPTVTRPGYGFAGWSPSLPAGVPAEDTVYTAQWILTTYEVRPAEEGMLAVNITGWQADYSYQVWSYQRVTSDLQLNGESNVPVNQWILSLPYTPGSEGVLQGDNSINFIIANFVSPEANYIIAVRVVDAAGNFVAEMRDSYTPTEIGLPVITDVLVDGQTAKGRNNEEGIYIGNGQFITADLYENNFKGPEIREIKTGASVAIQVLGNAACTEYTATVAETMATLTANGNEFTWDISGLEPRTYNLIITAGDGSATDTVYMLFKLYKTSATYGVLNALAVGTPATGTAAQTLSVTPGFTGGLFNYWVREEGRTAQFRSAQFASAGGISYDFTKYGTYAVQGYVYRPGIAPQDDYESFDDVAKVFVNIKRGAGTASVDLGASSNPVAKGTPITLTASNASIPGIGATPLQYSFWRYDADGYKLLKDWSSSNTLNWTPGRVGDYPIEVRVKGEDAGSYEARTSLTVTVTDNTDAKAVVTDITAVVDGTASARIPVVIRAQATASNGEDLLYKFNVGDTMFGRKTVQNYSADQELIWTPREAGTYYIDVLVKSSDSFGIYDAKETLTVIVN